MTPLSRFSYVVAVSSAVLSHELLTFIAAGVGFVSEIGAVAAATARANRAGLGDR